jgi:transcriptional regulator with XRE-family HTH domain
VPRLGPTGHSLKSMFARATPDQGQLGRTIRELRHGRGLTIEALAELSGLDWTYLSGIERGLRNPTLKVLAAIAAALDMKTSELIGLAEDDGV